MMPVLQDEHAQTTKELVSIVLRAIGDESTATRFGEQFEKDELQRDWRGGGEARGRFRNEEKGVEFSGNFRQPSWQVVYGVTKSDIEIIS